MKIIVSGIFRKMHVLGRNNVYLRNVRREEPFKSLRDLEQKLRGK